MKNSLLLTLGFSIPCVFFCQPTHATIAAIPHHLQLPVIVALNAIEPLGLTPEQIAEITNHLAEPSTNSTETVQYTVELLNSAFESNAFEINLVDITNTPATLITILARDQSFEMTLAEYQQMSDMLFGLSELALPNFEPMMTLTAQLKVETPAAIIGALLDLIRHLNNTVILITDVDLDQLDSLIESSDLDQLDRTIRKHSQLHWSLISLDGIKKLLKFLNNLIALYKPPNNLLVRGHEVLMDAMLALVKDYTILLRLQNSQLSTDEKRRLLCRISRDYSDNHLGFADDDLSRYEQQRRALELIRNEGNAFPKNWKKKLEDQHALSAELYLLQAAANADLLHSFFLEPQWQLINDLLAERNRFIYKIGSSVGFTKRDCECEDISHNLETFKNNCNEEAKKKIEEKKKVQQDQMEKLKSSQPKKHKDKKPKKDKEKKVHLLFRRHSSSDHHASTSSAENDSTQKAASTGSVINNHNGRRHGDKSSQIHPVKSDSSLSEKGA